MAAPGYSDITEILIIFNQIWTGRKKVDRHDLFGGNRCMQG